MKKTGFIAIVGRPNVGKSTLLNAILGEKVAIVSSKPQTTRNRITGIHTDGENQFVFLDTPGIHAPKNALGEYMVKTANSTMGDADVIIFVDRMEVFENSNTNAIKEIERELNVRIHAIVTLDDIINSLERQIIKGYEFIEPLKKYKQEYGGKQ